MNVDMYNNIKAVHILMAYMIQQEIRILIMITLCGVNDYLYLKSMHFYSFQYSSKEYHY